MNSSLKFEQRDAIMSVMDWLTILGALVSGAVAGGLAIGVMKGQVNSQNRQIDDIKSRALDAHRRIDTIMNGKRSHHPD